MLKKIHYNPESHPMQARPLSITAARITPTSPSAQHPRALQAGGDSPHLSVARAKKGVSGFCAELISGLAYEEMTSGLAAKLGSAFARSQPVTPGTLPAESPTSTLQAVSLADGAGLAHDAGNLLSALGLYCDLLQAPGVLQPEHQHYAEELRKLAGRSGSMIQRLLIANLPATEEAHPPSCDPAAVLSDQAAILDSVAGAWATVTVEVQPGLTSAPMPTETLERITLNLVRNAAQAIQKVEEAKAEDEVTPGSIRVVFRQTAACLELCVEDDGPGLTPAMAASFVYPTLVPAGAAHGLGHRIVHELAHKSGGQISVRVRPGRGSAITLSWPVTEALANVDLPAPASGSDRGGSAA
jgi:hypothetical protein